MEISVLYVVLVICGDGLTRPVGVYSDKKKALKKVDEAPARYWIAESWNNEIEVEKETPLSDEQISEIYFAAEDVCDANLFARRIERAHGIDY